MRGALAAALRAPWLRDPLWTRARMVPSLDLRMEDALLRDSVSGQRLITSTRAMRMPTKHCHGVCRLRTNCRRP